MGKKLFEYTGIRYWSSSLLPALVGTTLPFWLQPPGFSFKFLTSVEFLIATVLFHAGFSCIYHGLSRRQELSWPKSRLFVFGTILIIAACLMGLHLNRYLYGIVFPYFGFAVLFLGCLYVIPPLSFFRRAGGEIVLAYGLGMLPVLGAYLVQVNDLTRRVYLVSLPLIAATGLWIWMEKLANRAIDS